ncbi:MAG: methylated-DNA--[protein]-cysteine S-methyltransferase [Prevotella sp.]|nr:methylated-DNA--[protein]-cysteine S-methyltransferase [Prevotella sp.]
MENVRFHRLYTPIGTLLVAEQEERIVRSVWEDCADARLSAGWEEDPQPSSRVLDEACRQLEEYFTGVRMTFDLPLCLSGTPFQQQAWQALLSVPYGKTVSYGEEAVRMRMPKAARAVGRANHDNPLMVIIPCHRVVRSDGTLGGYAGGLARKRWLLKREKESLAR